MADAFVLRAGDGDVAEVRRRLKYGQDVNALHRMLGYTALHAAVDGGHCEVVEELISAGASVNMKQAKTGDTPLHLAVSQSSRSTDIMTLLLEKGADPNIVNSKQQRPLELALEYRLPQALMLLAQPPGFVAEVLAECQTHTSLGIRWEPPVFAGVVTDCYEVEVKEQPQEPQYGKAAVKPKRKFIRRDCNVLASGLRPATSYQVRVRAHNLLGWGEWTEWIGGPTFQTTGTVPEAPRRLRVLFNTNTTVRVAWDAGAHNGAPPEQFKLQYMVSHRKDTSLDKCDNEAWDTYESRLNVALAARVPNDEHCGEDVVPVSMHGSGSGSGSGSGVSASGTASSGKRNSTKGRRKRGGASIRQDAPFNPWLWKPFTGHSAPARGAEATAGVSAPRSWDLGHDASGSVVSSRSRPSYGDSSSVAGRLLAMEMGIGSGSGASPGGPSAAILSSTRGSSDRVVVTPGTRSAFNPALSSASSMALRIRQKNPTPGTNTPATGAGAGAGGRPRLSWSKVSADGPAPPDSEPNFAHALASLRTWGSSETVPSSGSDRAGKLPDALAGTKLPDTRAPLWEMFRPDYLPAFPEPGPLESLGSWRYYEINVDGSTMKVSIPGLVAGSHVRFRVIGRNSTSWGLPSAWSKFFLPDAPVASGFGCTSMTVSFGAVNDGSSDESVQSSAHDALGITRMNKARFATYQLQYQERPEDTTAGHIVLRGKLSRGKKKQVGVAKADSESSSSGSDADQDDGVPGSAAPQGGAGSTTKSRKKARSGPPIDDETGWQDVSLDGLPPPAEVKGLRPATRYRFRYRRATIKDGSPIWPPWSSSCISVWYRTLDSPPSVPHGLNAVIRDVGTVLLSWHPPRPNGALLEARQVQYRMVAQRRQYHDLPPHMKPGGGSPRPVTQGSDHSLSPDRYFDEPEVVSKPAPDSPQFYGDDEIDKRWFDATSFYRVSPEHTWDAPRSGTLASKLGDESNNRELWVVEGLETAATYQFRVSVGNAVGWGAFSEASPNVSTQALPPAQPGPPSAQAHTPCSILVRWQLPQSRGAALDTCYLRKKVIRSSGHPDDSSSDEDEPIVLVPLEQPSKQNRRRTFERRRRSSACDPTEDPNAARSPSDWGKDVPLPDGVGCDIMMHSDNWGDPIPPFQSFQSVHVDKKDEDRSRCRVLQYQTVPKGRDVFVEVIIGPVFPGSSHRFRVQYGNSAGLGKTSDASGRCTTEADVPYPPGKPAVAMSSDSSAIVRWTQPHSNGGYITGYRLQCRRVLLYDRSAAESSDSNSSDEDTKDGGVTEGESEDDSDAEVPPESGPLSNAVRPPKRLSATQRNRRSEIDAAAGPKPALARIRPESDEVGKGAWVFCSEELDPVVTRDAYRGADDAAVESGKPVPLVRSPGGVGVQGHGPPGPGSAAVLPLRTPDDEPALPDNSVAPKRTDGYGLHMAWVVPDLRAGKRYQFRVLARNSAGWSQPSPASSVVRTAAKEPEPVHQQPVLRACSASALLVTWSVPRSNGSHVLEAEVEVAEDHGGSPDWQSVNLDAAGVKYRPPTEHPWVPIHSCPPASTGAKLGVLDMSVCRRLVPSRPWFQLLIPNLSPTSPYIARVRVRNSRGWCVWSPPSEPTSVLADVPSAPTSVKLVERSANTIIVGWSKPEHDHGGDLIGYRLQSRRIRRARLDHMRQDAPNDSDSDVDGGDEDVDSEDEGELPWEDVAEEVDPAEAAATAMPDVIRAFREDPTDVRGWAGRALELAARIKTSGMDQKVFEFAWPLTGARPGTHHEFRVAARNKVGLGPYAVLDRPVRTDATIPDTPPRPSAEAVADTPSAVYVRTEAPRSNGALVTKYQVAFCSLKGPEMPASVLTLLKSPTATRRTRDDEAGDSTSGLMFPESLEHEMDWMLGTTMAATSVTVTGTGSGTSGRSGCQVQLLLADLKPGAWYTFRLRCRNRVGWSDWTGGTDPVKTEAACPAKMEAPVVYCATSNRHFVAWRCPRSYGSEVLSYEVQRRKLRTKEDEAAEADSPRPADYASPDDKGKSQSRIVDGKVVQFRPVHWEDIDDVPAAKSRNPPKFAEWGNRRSLHAEVFDYVVRRDGKASPRRDKKEGMDDSPPFRHGYTTIQGLLPMETFEYRIRGRNERGSGPWSKPSKPAATLPTVPSVPGQPEISGGLHDPITLIWKKSRRNGANVTQYEVEIGTVPTAAAGLASPGAAAGSEGRGLEWAVVPGASAGRAAELRTAYYSARARPSAARGKGGPIFGPRFRASFRVRAQNKHGWSAWSPPAKLTWIVQLGGTALSDGLSTGAREAVDDGHEYSDEDRRRPSRTSDSSYGRRVGREEDEENCDGNESSGSASSSESDKRSESNSGHGSSHRRASYSSTASAVSWTAEMAADRFESGTSGAAGDTSPSNASVGISGRRSSASGGRLSNRRLPSDLPSPTVGPSSPVPESSDSPSPQLRKFKPRPPPPKGAPANRKRASPGSFVARPPPGTPPGSKKDAESPSVSARNPVTADRSPEKSPSAAKSSSVQSTRHTPSPSGGRTGVPGAAAGADVDRRPLLTHPRTQALAAAQIARMGVDSQEASTPPSMFDSGVSEVFSTPGSAPPDDSVVDQSSVSFRGPSRLFADDSIHEGSTHAGGAGVSAGISSRSGAVREHAGTSGALVGFSASLNQSPVASSAFGGGHSPASVVSEDSDRPVVPPRPRRRKVRTRRAKITSRVGKSSAEPQAAGTDGDGEGDEE